MHDVGTALLYVAFAATLATGLVGLSGAALRSPGLLAAARHGLFGSLLLFLAMDACLYYGILSHDFSNKYIAAYTDADMPLAYLIAGFWGGEKGALLFWTTSLTAFSCWSVLRNRSQTPVFLGWVTGILSLAIWFFVLLMAFESNPFEIFRTGGGPEDGKGLNPLLQNPLMAIHPPALLTGYIAFTVPFAFGMAALITGRLDSQWLRDTRKWTLVSWMFLSLGLILGGAWAYKELGWGGFWMWDPVENAGLIPWFTATAFLHSVMIQERRDMLKRWNAVLVCLTFLLTIFGTFLTRSQLIDSVHAFADSTLASYFLWYMALIAVISAVAIGWRWKQLRSEAHLDALMSREAFFILNNVLLVGCAFVVMWGTVFGQISEAEAVQAIYNRFAEMLGTVGLQVEPLQAKVQLGEPWFNRVMTPLGLLLLLLTGIGPLISWRRATRKNFEKNFRRPVVLTAWSTLVVAVGWLARRAFQQARWENLDFQTALARVVDGLGASEVYGLVAIAFAIFVTFTIAIEFHVGARARQKVHGSGYLVSLLMLTLRNKRRYGGYIVHLGIVMCFLAFTGNAFRNYQPEVALHPGDRVLLDDYSLTLAGLSDGWEPDGAYAWSRAQVVVVGRDEQVPAGKAAELAALAKPFGSPKIATPAGTPRVELTFADAVAGKRFGARHLAGSLQGRIDQLRADTQDPRVLHASLAPEMLTIAEVSPPTVMKIFAELRDHARDRAPTPLELKTVPGQMNFQLVFANPSERERFQKDYAAGPLPGVAMAQVNTKLQVAGGGVRVDVIPTGLGSWLEPEVRAYKKHQSPTTEVAIRSTFEHDLYLAMRPAQGQRFVSLLAVVFPMVSMLWLGAFVLLFGGAVCLLPTRSKSTAEESEADTVPPARQREPAKTLEPQVALEAVDG